ncbi:MAG: sulfatase-like hydrolase/transferase [Rhodocyclaceae bacterium]|jgi:phosphoglycerol transferase|nr:sulfatase-like hydrolase/transferase [Rhodocyclaceae bacterium]
MRLRSVAKPLAYLLGCLLYGVSDWLTDEFGSVTVDQVLYHLSFGASGLLNSDPELFWRFVRRALVLPMGMGLGLWGVDAFIGYSRVHGVSATWARIGAALGAAWNGLGRAGHLAVALGHRVFHRRLPWLVALAGAIYFIDSFSLVSYVRQYFGPDYFSGSYVAPRLATSKGKEKPRNLVLIYVESLENTYSDPNLFGHDLLARLNALKDRGAVSFEDYQQMPGAHFTIAGIVSSQCGMPLKSLAMFSGNEQGEKVARFLPRATCLGDILARQGYSNTFLNGSSLEFAGVGKFLSDHHYKKVVGREEWIGLGEKQETMSGWGLYDDDLFRRARGELAMLMKAGKPFNLTLLTIDTHHPYGQLSTRCRRDGYSDFEGIVECTANQVAEFIEHIEKNGWMDKVAVVVQGDHLAMGNTAYDKLTSNPHRTVFNLLMTGHRKLTKNTEQVTHFDMLPTILELMGFTVEGERAGLGYTALGPATAPRPADRLATMNAQLMNYSQAYRDLWDQPQPPAEVAAPTEPSPAPAPLSTRTSALN